MDIFAAGCVLYKIVRGKCRIIIIKKSETGHWSLPKGKFLPPETSGQAALRELLEETGLKGKLLKKIDAVHYVYKDKTGGNIQKYVVFFLAHFSEGCITAGYPEVEEVKWTEISDAFKYLHYPLEKQILRKAEMLLSCQGLYEH